MDMAKNNVMSQRVGIVQRPNLIFPQFRSLPIHRIFKIPQFPNRILCIPFDSVIGTQLTTI